MNQEMFFVPPMDDMACYPWWLLGVMNTFPCLCHSPERGAGRIVKSRDIDTYTVIIKVVYNYFV
jgi:hypothetical protein